MADKKISELVSLAGKDVAATDLFPVVDVSVTETKSLTRDELRNAVNAIQFTATKALATTAAASLPDDTIIEVAADESLAGARTRYKVAAGGLVFAYGVATQAELDAVAGAKVDKVTGKGLSTEDYSTGDKSRVAGLELVPKNLYDKSLAVDGVLLNYSGGATAAYANGIVLGFMPVSAGKTYTLSMRSAPWFHSDRAIFCRNSAGTYIGIDHTVGATAGMASPPTNIKWRGLYSVTFTIPVGSPIAFISLMLAYSVHSGADFTAIVGGIQLEEGDTATGYKQYDANGLPALKEEALPDSIGKRFQEGQVRLLKSGDILYIRGMFDENEDVVQKVTLATGTAFTNDVVNITGIRKVKDDYFDDATAWAAGTAVTTEGDSSAPLKYNGTYIGANHGPNIVREVTATAHGKTVEDVGSEWTDGAAVKWYLMRVVDANKLWFVSKNGAVYPQWSFTTTLTGNLTHSANATHTSSITVAGTVLTQLTPIIKNQKKIIYLNGSKKITGDGVYKCDFVDVVNSYQICNPAGVVNYVISKVGSALQPAFNDNSIDADVSYSVTYRFAENASCTITESVKSLNTLTLTYFGTTQGQELPFSGKKLWQYIPRSTPKVGTLKTWNFAAQEDISGTFEEVTIGSSNWTDANNPPDRLAQIVKSSGGVSEFGLMLGYSPVRAIGVPAVRKTLVTDACFVSALKKQYPMAVTGGTLTPSSYYESVAYRAIWSSANNTDATVFTWYRDGRSIIVVVDFHKDVSFSVLPLPQKFVGMDVAVVDKTASMTLHGNGVLSAGGLLVSVTGGYGYGVFKLS